MILFVVKGCEIFIRKFICELNFEVASKMKFEVDFARLDGGVLKSRSFLTFTHSHLEESIQSSYTWLFHPHIYHITGEYTRPLTSCVKRPDFKKPAYSRHKLVR